MNFMVDYASWVECSDCESPVEAHGYTFDISEAPELKPDLIEHGTLSEKIPCGIQCQCGSTRGMETLTLERLATYFDFGDRN